MYVKQIATKAERSIPLPFRQMELETMDTPQVGAFEALRQFVIAERTRQRLSQREVAKRGGMSYGVLATLEAGKVPTIPRQTSLEKIAKGLGVPYEQLDRIARGLPPDDAAIDKATDDLLAAWSQLPDDCRDIILRMAQALREQQSNR